jgi:epoxyqueuosine reductase
MAWPNDPLKATERVLALAREQGFAAAGVTPASPTAYASELRAWLAAGKHGSMAWLMEQSTERLDPTLVLPTARWMIMVADQYDRRGRVDGELAPGQGRIARYARGRDYHPVIKRRLHTLADALRPEFPGHHFRSFVDTAPVLEREYAARAGLGWTGKHTLTIHPRLGSYVLLGGILTSLELRAPEEQPVSEDHCGTCTRCIDACPTGAITPYSVDASRCISYLTIEHEGLVPAEFQGPIGEWVYGCDVCQEVCPHNSAREAGADVGVAREDYRQRRDRFELLEVLRWNEGSRRGAFTTSAMKRASLEVMRRNAVIAAANWIARIERGEVSGLTGGRDAARSPEAIAMALRGRLGEIAADAGESETVRLTASRALERVNGLPRGR